jgi:hypothetical protein
MTIDDQLRAWGGSLRERIETPPDILSLATPTVPQLPGGSRRLRRFASVAAAAIVLILAVAVVLATSRREARTNATGATSSAADSPSTTPSSDPGPPSLIPTVSQRALAVDFITVRRPTSEEAAPALDSNQALQRYWNKSGLDSSVQRKLILTTVLLVVDDSTQPPHLDWVIVLKPGQSTTLLGGPARRQLPRSNLVTNWAFIMLDAQTGEYLGTVEG